MRRSLLLLSLVAASTFACSKEEKKTAEDDAVISKIDGKAKLDGKNVEIESCKAVKGEKDHTALELVVGGVTIRQDQLEGLTVDGKKVECSRTSSSSSSGSFGAKVWSKGKLGLTCETKKGELELDVEYDCGAKSRPTNFIQ